MIRYSTEWCLLMISYHLMQALRLHSLCLCDYSQGDMHPDNMIVMMNLPNRSMEGWVGKSLLVGNRKTHVGRSWQMFTVVLCAKRYSLIPFLWTSFQLLHSWWWVGMQMECKQLRCHFVVWALFKQQWMRTSKARIKVWHAVSTFAFQPFHCHGNTCLYCHHLEALLAQV